ncbi:MAG TPA: Hsp20/alpha crystallin family protein [Armatimonadota bacterium]|jgi:HSP20 family protein
MATRALVPQARDNELARRWNPWSLFEDMDRYFGRSPLFPTLGEGLSAGYAPKVDLYSTKDEIVFRAYTPGMKRDDLDLQVTSDAISLSGQMKPHEAPEGSTWHVSSASAGTFELRYDLPVEVNTSKASATYSDGVLEVHLPKSDSAKTRSVKIDIK